jgi:SAM-dependent methyltransferase
MTCLSHRGVPQFIVRMYKPDNDPADTIQDVKDLYDAFPYPEYSVQYILSGRPSICGDDLCKTLEDSVPDTYKKSIRIGTRTVLDVGCGTGQNLLGVWSRCAADRCVGIERSTTSLQYMDAIRRSLATVIPEVCATRGTLDIRQMDIEIEDIEDLGEFGIVFCTGVIHHLGDPFRMLHKLCRVVAPGGYLKLAWYSHSARKAMGIKHMPNPDNKPVSLSDLLEWRQELFSGALRQIRETKRVNNIAEFRDLYSLGGSLDLLANPTEQNLDLCEVVNACTRENLKFVSMKTGNETLTNVAPVGDVQYWVNVEREDPCAFKSMYVAVFYRPT